MIGRKKLDLVDVAKLKQMIEFGHTNKVIAENFNITAQMVKLIREGKRWPEHRPKVFIQKEEFDLLPFIREYVMVNKFQGINLLSKISPIMTLNGTIYVIIHYLNNEVTSERFSGFFEEVPTYDKLKNIHNKFVESIL
jgi:hypothetical protein